METIHKNNISNKSLVNNQQHPFHLVKASPWPICVAFSLFQSLVYTVLWMHGYFAEDLNVEENGLVAYFWIGIPLFIFSVISWLWDIIIEATFEGRHTKAVQQGLRIGFILFIVSEIMFFFSFFWAFFHSSVSPSIWIGAVWPPRGIVVINPYALPLLNTVILLSSGVTVTWAHKAMATPRVPINEPTKDGYNARVSVIQGLLVTIFLGIYFTCIQLYEYQHASFSINDSVYGSIFYLITGFHGFHVLVGTIFLLVCFFRHLAYHFTRDHHLGFEMAIWYWHFVDIVRIFLYVFIYIWGS
jgi:cytochrome c oxidase subunit 3